MTDVVALPDEMDIMINAWTGADSPHAEAEAMRAARWATRRSANPSEFGKLAPAVIDRRNWMSEDVGWGIILFDDEQVPVDQRHTAAGAPDCIQQLVAARGNAPVFRFDPRAPAGFLFRYAPDGTRSAPIMDASARRGSRPGELPWYLLIVAGPDRVPWWVQYHLNLVAYTGRLALEGGALENYVSALMQGWPESTAQRTKPVVWSTDLGFKDITWLMSQVVADQVASAYNGDSEIAPGALRRIMKDDATGANLVAALADSHPALVVTTSHGKTGPLDAPGQMLEELGMLVDQTGDAIAPGDVLGNWSPDGAIWYAHACCSAGSDHESRFVDLVPEGSNVQLVLKAVAALNDHVAPFPTALLGASKPLKAFIGHVEPTFDWTLRHPATRQVLTDGIVRALYNELFQANPVPVGMAMDAVYRSVAGQQNLANQLRNEANDVTKREAARKEMIRAQLLAHDRQSMVILGDPTVAMRPP